MSMRIRSRVYPASRLMLTIWYSLPCRLISMAVPSAGSGSRGLVAGLGGAQPVGVGAGGDDVRVEGEPVDDGGAEPGVGEGGCPLGEGGVGRDGDGGAFFALGEDLEQQFGAAPVQLEVAQLVQAEQVDPAVAGDGAGQGLVVGGPDPP